jgi:hypothetical protein
MDDLNTIGKRRGKSTKAKTQSRGKIVQFLGLCMAGLQQVLLRFKGLVLCLAMVVLVWGGLTAFAEIYYHRNDVFMIAPEDIVVRGNSTVTQEYILQCFEITKPRNGYELVQSDIVQRLCHLMPILKDAKMTYTVGGKLEIWVEERMPLAQIAGDIRPPLVVDEEGMIFIYSRATGGYPEVGGFDLPDEVLCPGQKLPESLHCMLRLLSVASDTTKFFPSAVKRVSLLGIDPDDGLKVTLVDGRKIDIAWDGMATETAISEGMVDRLHKIARVLRSSAAEGMTHFNAMAPDRVTVSE